MVKIESNNKVINKPASAVYGFLSDFNNFGKMMPEQVVSWESTENDCTFTIKGMATLGMQFVDKKPNAELNIVPKGKVPFDFTLQCLLTESGNDCTVKLIMNADLNMMMKMMAEKPLTNFLNMLVDKLKELEPQY
jgi:carbon monoxide dehydrogenase subunit G